MIMIMIMKSIVNDNEIMKKALPLSEGGKVGLIDVWIDLVSVAQSVEHSPG